MSARRSFMAIGLSAIALLASFQFTHAEFRIWTNGDEYFEAELVHVDREQITFQTKQGERKKVFLKDLSGPDREYALSKLKPAAVVAPKGEKAGTTAAPEPEKPLTFGQLEKAAIRRRNAAEVLSIFERYYADDTYPLSERVRAQNALPKWRAHAERGAIRVGTIWVSPDDYLTMQTEEKSLIEGAHRLMNVGDYRGARDMFHDASKLNPHEVRADFYLGLLNSLLEPSPPTAFLHFKTCVDRLKRDDDLLVGTRKANLIAALNNLALIQVRQAKYNQSIALWKQAIALEPHTPELAQNLGRMIFLSQANIIKIGPATERSASALYAQATTQFHLKAFDKEVGWLYMPYIDTFDGDYDPEGDEELIPVAACTGFSVGGNLVLTSYHPMRDAEAAAITNGGPTFSNLKGKIVSLGPSSNLALLRFEGLNAKAIPINKAQPKAAQDVTIVGFGQPGIGSTLQDRVATILSPPNILKLFDEMVSRNVDGTTEITNAVYVDFPPRHSIVHDAVTNPGVEGGPLIDSNGTLVGIHLNSRSGYGQKGYAVSIEHALPFLSATGGEFELVEKEHDPSKLLSPTELDRVTEGSVFQLISQRRAPRLSWSQQIAKLHELKTEQNGWTSYEDNTCMLCNGQGWRDCPDCRRGTVYVPTTKVVGRNTVTGEPLHSKTTIKRACGRCGASGKVDCPMCDRGVAKSP